MMNPDRQMALSGEAEKDLGICLVSPASSGYQAFLFVGGPVLSGPCISSSDVPLSFNDSCVVK